MVPQRDEEAVKRPKVCINEMLLAERGLAGAE
jgi:hypothetical protein